MPADLEAALAAVRCIPHPPCPHHPKEPDMKLEDHPSPDVIHDRMEDCSTRRRVTGVEAEVCDLLELQPEHRPWLRLSDAQWRRVDALVARIERGPLPTPRLPVQPSTGAEVTR